MSRNDDITWNYHGGNVFSIAANLRATRYTKARDIALILNLLALHPRGLTPDEIAVRLGKTQARQTISARCSDLRLRHGLVKLTGEIRMTQKNSPAGVICLVSKILR